MCAGRHRDDERGGDDARGEDTVGDAKVGVAAIGVWFVETVVGALRRVDATGGPGADVPRARVVNRRRRYANEKRVCR